jgi:hypothetical protein
MPRHQRPARGGAERWPPCSRWQADDPPDLVWHFAAATFSTRSIGTAGAASAMRLQPKMRRAPCSPVPSRPTPGRLPWRTLTNAPKSTSAERLRPMPPVPMVRSRAAPPPAGNPPSRQMAHRQRLVQDPIPRLNPASGCRKRCCCIISMRPILGRSQRPTCRAEVLPASEDAPLRSTRVARKPLWSAAIRCARGFPIARHQGRVPRVRRVLAPVQRRANGLLCVAAAAAPRSGPTPRSHRRRARRRRRAGPPPDCPLTAAGRTAYKDIMATRKGVRRR